MDDGVRLRQFAEQDTLTLSAWTPICVDSGQFGRLLLKLRFSEAALQVLASDLETIWEETVDPWLTRCRRCNPNVEASDDELRRSVEKVLLGGVSTSVECERLADDKIVVTFTSYDGDVPFGWQFQGAALPRHDVFVHLTEPLLATVAELRRRELVLTMECAGGERTRSDWEAWSEAQLCSEAAVAHCRRNRGAAGFGVFTDRHMNRIVTAAQTVNEYAKAHPEPPRPNDDAASAATTGDASNDDELPAVDGDSYDPPKKKGRAAAAPRKIGRL